MRSDAPARHWWHPALPWVARVEPGALAGFPVVVAGVAVVFYRDLGLHRALIVTAFALVTAAVVRIDIRSLRAPNALTYPAVVGALLAAATLGTDAFVEACAGGAAGFGVLYAAALLSRGSMGMGDVKFGAFCAAVAGWQGLAAMLVAAFLAGAIFAAVLLALRVRRRTDVLAFTPFLAFGTMCSLLLAGGYLVR